MKYAPLVFAWIIRAAFTFVAIVAAWLVSLALAIAAPCVGLAVTAWLLFRLAR